MLIATYFVLMGGAPLIILYVHSFIAHVPTECTVLLAMMRLSEVLKIFRMPAFLANLTGPTRPRMPALITDA